MECLRAVFSIRTEIVILASLMASINSNYNVASSDVPTNYLLNSLISPRAENIGYPKWMNAQKWAEKGGGEGGK